MDKHADFVLFRRGPAAVNDRAPPPTAPGRQTYAMISCAIQQRHLASVSSQSGSSISTLCSMAPDMRVSLYPSITNTPTLVFSHPVLLNY